MYLQWECTLLCHFWGSKPQWKIVENSCNGKNSNKSSDLGPMKFS